MNNVSVIRKNSRVGTHGSVVGDSDSNSASFLSDSDLVAKRFRSLGAILKAYQSHSWTNATVNVVGRSIVGIGSTLVPDEEYEGYASIASKAKIKRFLDFQNARFENIKDFVSFSSKIAQTAMCLKLLGQCAWEIVRVNGVPVGFDVVSGFVRPNTDEHGNFLSPPFIATPWTAKSHHETIGYELEDIAFFFDPGVTGNVTGETTYDSLAVTAIPSDLSAGTSYRELFYNSNAPYNGHWEVDSSVSNDDFDAFYNLLEDRYSGPENFGRNPLIIRGTVDFKPTQSRSSEDAPYLEGREYNRQEISAVTGVDGNKLGVTDSSNKANMRETRREFHENVMRPLVNWLEDEIYRQVFVRILGVKGWRLKFNRPDFMNALEQSTIDSRDIQSGILSPNEVRLKRGMEKRKGGDEFHVAPGSQMPGQGANGDQGEPDPAKAKPDDSKVKETERPPRDESDTSKDAAMGHVKELKAWRKHYLRMMDNKIPEKVFIFRFLSSDFVEPVRNLLNDCEGDFDTVKRVFDAAQDCLENLSVYGGENE